MKLYHAHWSPNCLKVKLAAAELGLTDAIEMVEINPFETRMLADERLNPCNKVPTLVDAGATVWESGAIVMHLAHAHGGLLPADPTDRTLAVILLFYETGSIAPIIGGDGIFGELGKPEADRDMARVERLIGVLGPRLAVLDALLADGRPYLAREFSVADIQLFAGLRKVVEHGVAPTSQLLRDWVDRVTNRDAVSGVLEQGAK